MCVCVCVCGSKFYLFSSCSHCVTDLSGQRKSRTERYLHEVIKKVKTELKSSVAPRHKGIRSIIGARQRKVSDKMLQCMLL